jgi:transposase-like protein
MQFTVEEEYELLMISIPLLRYMYDNNGKFTPMYKKIHTINVGTIPIDYEDEYEYDYEKINIEVKKDNITKDDITKDNITKDDITKDLKKKFNPSEKVYEKSINGYLDLVIDIGLYEQLSPSYILYATLNDIFKGIVKIHIGLRRKDYIKYFYLFYDKLMDMGARFPVDLLFRRVFPDPNAKFEDEVYRYILHGISIDYLVIRKIQTDFSKYCNWKDIKAQSLIGHARYYDLNKISISSFNEITDEKRYSVLKFYSEHLSKIK